MFKLWSLLALVITLVACSSPAIERHADIVLINADIHTSDTTRPTASAIAIQDRTFSYVGQDASTHIGPETKVFDLGGKTVIPGIIDSHSHPGWVALSTNVSELEDTSSLDALITSIEKMVTEDTTSDILIGGFWPNELFGVNGPTRNILDKIEPTRPLILYDSWGHTVWANTAALDYAGITSETKDLVPGFSFYQRDKKGVATGWITESAATAFVKKFQTITPDIEKTLLEYLSYYRNLGVTTILDAGNFGLDREVYAVISRLDKEGKLPVRYHGSYTLFKPDDLDNAVESLKALGQEFNSEQVQIDTLKLFFDGVLETRTAALTESYLDAPGNKGDMLLSQDQVHRLILDLEHEDLNLHVHAVGNLATTTILNAVEQAHQTLTRPPTIGITICHLEVVDDADISRFKRLGVVANFTPHWWVGGSTPWVTQGIGNKAQHMQRARSFIDAGVTVTFSSDITDIYEWKTDRANPFLGMQMGHNRLDISSDSNTEIMPPRDERVKRSDLVSGYTNNAAHQLRRTEELGSISIGKRADLIVLDRNLFDIDRYQIHNTKPVAVVIDGKLVSGRFIAEHETK
jgi:predicted amidohydrolase YtcJ